MLGVNPAEQLAFVEAEADGMVGLPRSGSPGGLLLREGHRSAIELGDNVLVDHRVESGQDRLVGH